MAVNELANQLGRWAAEHLGFDARALRADRLVDLARREVQRRGSHAAVSAALRARDAELEAAVVAAVTVGETYFYRQREHFDLLAQLPPPRPGGLLAWSAGCSTGEEAYSLAAVLRGCTGLEAPRLEIWGSDVNAAALANARRADYGTWSWRGLGLDAVRPLQAEALSAPTRACVRFAQHNLLEPPHFDGRDGERFDLVFCRNVLVYLSPLAAAQALAHLADAMRPGAWLVLGSTDLPGSPVGFRRVGPPALCVFAKDAVPAPAAEAPAPVPPPPAEPAAPRARPAADDDPVDWHGRVLALLEDGQRGEGLRQLGQLVRAHPDYLPGRFEHGLALRRAGRLAAARAELDSLLKQAQGREPGELVLGPEILSLEYYVSSARNFIDSHGGAA